MSGHKWEAFNPIGPLCELCGIAKDTQYADMRCTGRLDPKDIEIDTLKSRIKELESQVDEGGAVSWQRKFNGDPTADADMCEHGLYPLRECFTCEKSRADWHEARVDELESQNELLTISREAWKRSSDSMAARVGILEEKRSEERVAELKANP